MEKDNAEKQIQEIKPNDWPNEPRLKMIEKSEFYYESGKVYQYGFYDGYQYQNAKVIELTEKINELQSLLKQLETTQD